MQSGLKLVADKTVALRWAMVRQDCFWLQEGGETPWRPLPYPAAGWVPPLRCRGYVRVEEDVGTG